MQDPDNIHYILLYYPTLEEKLEELNNIYIKYKQEVIEEWKKQKELEKLPILTTEEVIHKMTMYFGESIEKQIEECKIKFNNNKTG